MCRHHRTDRSSKMIFVVVASYIIHASCIHKNRSHFSSIMNPKDAAMLAGLNGLER